MPGFLPIFPKIAIIPPSEECCRAVILRIKPRGNILLGLCVANIPRHHPHTIIVRPEASRLEPPAPRHLHDPGKPSPLRPEFSRRYKKANWSRPEAAPPARRQRARLKLLMPWDAGRQL
jgi:hypothetical protein